LQNRALDWVTNEKIRTAAAEVIQYGQCPIVAGSLKQMCRERLDWSFQLLATVHCSIGARPHEEALPKLVPRVIGVGVEPCLLVGIAGFRRLSNSVLRAD
jgi:hypothetical protein